MSSLWNLELELKALKTILTTNSPWSPKLFGVCRDDHFYHKTSKTLYKRLKELFNDSKQLDIISLGFLLTDSEVPESIKESAAESMRDVPIVESQGDFDYLINQLNKLVKLRKLYRGTSEAADALMKEDEKPKEELILEISNKLGETLLSLDDEEEMGAQIQMGSGYNQEAEDCFQRLLYGVFAKSMIKSGFREFDDRTGGFNRTNLVVLGASSGGGKSLFAVNLLVRQYRMGFNVYLASFEMTEDEVMVRILSCISEVPMNDIITGKLTPEQKQRCNAAWREFNLLGAEKGNSYTVYCPRSECSVAELGYRAKSLKPDSLIIDYINLIHSSKQLEQQWQELGQIAKESKILANRLNCVVFTLAQVDETLNLRYSKGIRDHANFVWSWIRDDAAVETNLVEINQTKARNAPIYKFNLETRFEIAQYRDPGQQDREIWPDERQEAEMVERLEALGLVHDRSDLEAYEEALLGKKPKKKENITKEDIELNESGEPIQAVNKRKKRPELLWTAGDITPVDMSSLVL